MFQVFNRDCCLFYSIDDDRAPPSPSSIRQHKLEQQVSVFRLTAFYVHPALSLKNTSKQECIPVGYVPPEAVAVPGGLHQATLPPGRSTHPLPREEPPPLLTE